jgi:hypothetical protein
MIPRHLYWFLYRRRNKFLIILLFIFTIIFFSYESKNDSSSAYSQVIDRPKRNLNQKKIRINRDTYKIPETCRNCPGENGGGVSLTVIEYEKFNKDCLVRLFRLKNPKI